MAHPIKQVNPPPPPTPKFGKLPPVVVPGTVVKKTTSAAISKAAFMSKLGTVASGIARAATLIPGPVGMGLKLLASSVLIDAIIWIGEQVYDYVIAALMPECSDKTETMPKVASEAIEVVVQLLSDNVVASQIPGSRAALNALQAAQPFLHLIGPSTSQSSTIQGGV